MVGCQESRSCQQSPNSAFLHRLDHQTELRLWETYAAPPKNKDAAGKVVINLAKMAAVRHYG